MTKTPDMLYSHFTVLVLPNGGVHANGTLLRGPDPWPLIHQAWHVPREAAERIGYPVRISVGRPDGSVDAYLLSGDGSHTKTTAHPSLAPLEWPDPRWSDGVLGQHPLLAPVRAAHAAGDLEQARQAARHLTDQIEQGMSPAHPYSVLARELQGYFALLAHDWLSAAGHYAAAGETRYRIQAPAEQTSTTLDNAVAAWMAGADAQAPDAVESGCGLAHTLLRAAPGGAQRIAAVLERLGVLGAASPEPPTA